MDAVRFSAAGIQPLLEAMLARVRRAGDTPLQFGINGAEIAGNAWKEFIAEQPLPPGHHGENEARATAALNNLLDQILPHDSGTPERNGSVRCHDWARADGSSASTVAEWLERLYVAARLTHSRALELVDLRIRGFSEQDIAAQLGWGSRLVRRILSDLRAQRAATRGPEVAS